VAVGVLGSFKSMLGEMLPRMSQEGRPILTVAFGCTGGQHRSVWAAESVSAWLRDQGYSVQLTHRELQEGR
ncbi:MAG: RNase adapter RapZ, partial [Pseudomonadota bacterium]|nr:RNase adapter RapZ [Pseudomonadota bacterium]